MLLKLELYLVVLPDWLHCSTSEVWVEPQQAQEQNDPLWLPCYGVDDIKTWSIAQPVKFLMCGALQDNKAFNKPVKFAQFYYVDKFLLATCGHVFCLYKYHLDTRKSDIKRWVTPLTTDNFLLIVNWYLR